MVSKMPGDRVISWGISRFQLQDGMKTNMINRYSRMEGQGRDEYKHEKRQNLSAIRGRLPENGIPRNMHFCARGYAAS